MKTYDVPVEGMPHVDPEAAADWKPEDKVIVIDAGMAGISAAYTLKYLNVLFIVKDKIEYGAAERRLTTPLLDKVKVILANGNVHQGAKVIGATPLSAIKRRHLIFKPDLCKEKKAVLEKTRIRPGFKVAIQFKKRFYEDVFFEQGSMSYLFTVVTCYGSEKTYFDALLGKGIDDKHILGLYFYGTMARDLSNLDNDDLFAVVMEKLDLMYDGQATEIYVKHTIKNWTNEPHIHGVFSHAKYTIQLTAAFVENPMDDRIFFACEHVSGKFMPTVHGAGFSGRRAAINAIWKEYHYF